jgi:hypothetical protein
MIPPTTEMGTRESQYSRLQRPGQLVEGTYSHLSPHNKAARQTAWEPHLDIAPAEPWSGESVRTKANTAYEALPPRAEDTRTRINTVYESAAEQGRSRVNATYEETAATSSFSSRPLPRTDSASRTRVNTVYEPKAAASRPRKVSFDADVSSDEEEERRPAATDTSAAITLEQNLLELQDLERTLHDLLIV